MLASVNAYDWLQKEEYPQWLSSLQEEKCPLLSRTQCEYIADVCSYIAKNVRSKPNTASSSRIRELKQISDNMKKNFKCVVEKLQMNFESRRSFQRKYPEWRSFRDMNIKHLKEIADTIDTHRKICQVSKTIGSLASLIGGGICLASEGNDDNRTSQRIGSALMGIGTLTTAGTTVLEEILLQENVDKSKDIMHLDKKHIMYLINCLDEASSLKKAMDNINSIRCSGIDLRLDFVQVADSFQNVSKLNLSAPQKLREFQKIAKSLNLPSGLEEEVVDTIGILISASMLFKRYYPVFKVASQSRRVKNQLRLSADLFRATYVGGNSVAIFAQSDNRMTSGQKIRVVSGMALDAMDILIVNLQDPKSVEGREIRKVAAELEEEAKQLESLYEEIRHLNY